MTEEITLTVERKPRCKVELTVKAAPPLIQKAKKQAIKKISKEVSIPGFRKGKAPDDLIEKNYQSLLKQEQDQELADLLFAASQAKTDLHPLTQNTSISYNLVKYTPEGAEITFSYETAPEPPPIDPKAFQLAPVTRPEVTEEQIDEGIRQAIFFFATWQEKEAPIALGDYVILDIDTNEEKVFKDLRFEFSDKSMSKWLQNAVIGAKKGDILTAISKPDETASEEEKKVFTPKECKITVKLVENAILPPLDEALAKKLGASSVEALRKNFADMLNQKVDDYVTSEKLKQADKFLLSFPFEIPPTLLQAEYSHRLKELQKDPSFDKLSPQEKKPIEEQLLKTSEELLRLVYISKKVVDDANIPLSQSEIEKEVQFLSKKLPPTDLYGIAYTNIIIRKAREYILKTV